MSENSTFRLFLTSVSGRLPQHEDGWGLGALEELRRTASLSKNEGVRLANDADSADAILFVECRDHGLFQEGVRRSALYRNYRNKCLIYDPADFPMPTLPGLYPSLIAGSMPSSWAESTAYVHQELPQFDALPRAVEDPYLFSFAGTIDNHPVRQALLQLDSPRTPIIDIRNAVVLAGYAGDTEGIARWRQEHSALGSRSLFMLCPAGRGVGSMRLFEAMMMARPPVILSDGWVPVPGPDWDRFSVRVAERDVASLPEILQSRAHEAEAMGLRARSAWEEWFGPEAIFDTVAAQCRRLVKSRPSPSEIRSIRRSYFVNREVARHYARSKKQRWREYRRASNMRKSVESEVNSET